MIALYLISHLALSSVAGCDAFFLLVAPQTTRSRLGNHDNHDVVGGRVRSSAAMTSPSSTTTITEFSGGFDTDRIDALTERGILEEKLMNGNAGGLLEEIVKKSNNKKKKKKNDNDAAKQKRPSTAMFARTLSQDGVVRLNGSLSAATAAALREDILNRRDDAFAAVISPMGKEQGSTKKEDWRNYFADVLLKRNRCDLLLPLKNNPHLQTALHEILVTSNVLSSVLQTATGGNDNDATLYELSALISEPGSPRQPVHPDNPHQEHPPLLTAFIALQNITPPMGPTIFLPRTNTADAHERYNNVPDRDEFLDRKSVV